MPCLALCAAAQSFTAQARRGHGQRWDWRLAWALLNSAAAQRSTQPRAPRPNPEPRPTTLQAEAQRNAGLRGCCSGPLRATCCLTLLWRQQQRTACTLADRQHSNAAWALLHEPSPEVPPRQWAGPDRPSPSQLCRWQRRPPILHIWDAQRQRAVQQFPLACCPAQQAEALRLAGIRRTEDSPPMGRIWLTLSRWICSLL